ncbi:hypothetical protein I3760_09G226100 [Carya illinoinensis]|uniref:Uncharacterized protein n=2 Tax=Carya illinoinensis TaxID=32201 RepID=A0A922J9H6_CARIL|nr:uncharacterized protein LOC122277730 [Carya illinoinensis]KAG2691209.1 hypothetical protein I3760_09G226100 [Carya illinoinensis]KAG6697987.1 hypothetical protein I3842_09G228800 [Carya illinoinensis]
MASLLRPPSLPLSVSLSISLSLFVSNPYFLFPIISSPPNSNTQIKMENGNEGLASLVVFNSSDTKQPTQSFQTQGNKLVEITQVYAFYDECLRKLCFEDH